MALSIRRRRRREVPQAAPTIRAGLRASAQRFTLANKKLTHAQAVPRREWQDEGWEHFDDVPEIKYSTWFMGNVMAKIRLYPAVVNPDDPDGDPIPATDPGSGLPAGAAARAQAEIDRLRSDLGGRAEIIRALNMNLEIAGEGYIVGFGPRDVAAVDAVTGQPITDQSGMPVMTQTDEEWGIFSVSQVYEQGGEFSIVMRPGDMKGRKLDKNLDTCIRVFQRHPRWSLEADCNMRGVLSDCEALVLLGNSIKADAKSRMSAGYLLIPNELSTGPELETEPEDGEEAAVDPFLQELYDGAVDPVEDPSSASAVAPTFVRGPADALEQFRHVEIKRSGDDKVLDKIQAAVERIARGMNLPVEVVMGHQQTTFANAVQVKQDTFDDHFQPRCVLICDAITVGFLVPNLVDAGMPPEIAERIVVWFDPSAMIKQVNPVDSADQGITLDLISGEAWRRAWGWSEDDAPDPIESLVRAVLHLTRFDPGVSTAVLELLDVPLDIPESLPGTNATAAPAASAQQAAALEKMLARAIAARYKGGAESTMTAILSDARELEAGTPVEDLRARALATLPTAREAHRNVGYNLMVLDRDLRSRLLVATDTALNRALEKAGNRLRAKAGKNRTLAKAANVHSVYVAATLGPALVAAAGLTDDDLISGDVWDSLEGSWRTWVAGAQSRALSLAGQVVTLSSAHRDELAGRQDRDLDRAWDWLKDQLHTLATGRLYSPDPAEPARGEHDPSIKTPVGLIREALARAGGATGITTVVRTNPLKAARAPGGDAAGMNIYVVVNDDKPVGGVGTGQLIMGVLEDGSAGVDAYEWVYGPAFRKSPFEEHESLDGEVFVSFESDVLLAGDWIGDYYFPGDHDGCNCDIAPIIVEPDALSDSEAASGVTDLGDVPNE